MAACKQHCCSAGWGRDPLFEPQRVALATRLATRHGDLCQWHLAPAVHNAGGCPGPNQTKCRSPFPVFVVAHQIAVVAVVEFGVIRLLRRGCGPASGAAGGAPLCWPLARLVVVAGQLLYTDAGSCIQSE